MEKKISQELQEEFKVEHGINWKNSQGEPDIDYVSWLEQKLLEYENSPYHKMQKNLRLIKELSREEIQEAMDRVDDEGNNYEGSPTIDEFVTALNDLDKMEEAIDFMNWSNDLTKCEFYPVYNQEKSSLDYWENRNDPTETTTTQGLYIIFKNR